MAETDQVGANPSRADELVARPAESLNVEIKNWLDPSDDLHVAKLVKGLFAIRNRNGGFLVVGFNDKTLQPDGYALGRPLEEAYHLDEIQGIVSRYAHESFEIQVRTGLRDGQLFPVIVVPEGVRTPVAVKRDLIDKATQRPLLTKGEIFFRTLESNGTPSSARIAPADLATLVGICFDNREADIGRFLRRQLGANGPDALRALFGGEPAPDAAQMLRDRAEALLARGDAAFDVAYAALRPEGRKPLYVDGLTMRVAMAADPTHPDQVASSEFMNRIAAANPQYTGWPAWLDARGFRQEADRARVDNGAWVTFIRGGDIGERERLEYQLLDPKGEFFARRLMQEDVVDSVQPFTALDPILMLYRVTEFIAAGIDVLRGAGWSEDDKAGFAFSWSGLARRRLSSWANPMRFLGVGEGSTSLTTTASSYVEVPLDTPHLALAPAVTAAVAPLFACFDGYQPPAAIVEDAVRRLVERQM